MKCSKCGFKLENGEKFCPKCGNCVEIKSENINNKKSNNEIISTIFGILAILSIDSFRIFTLIFGIIGLVFGLKEKKVINKFGVGIILNIIALCLLLICWFIIGTEYLFNRTESNYNNDSHISDNNTNDEDESDDTFSKYFLGTWNCGVVTNPSNYTFTVKLDGNKKYY